ncbi:MAG: hypothetical protein M3511_12450, partial [Deinococcota bacterium]|nr:hypothetical protein [Deinococcota bacterium]
MTRGFRSLNWRHLFALLLAAMLLLISVREVHAQGEMSSVPLNPEVSGNVEFWHFWGSPVRRNAIRRVIATCQQQLPNISVTESFKPFGDIWTANIAAVAGGSGMPDVIVADRIQLPRDADTGIYQSLQDFVDRDAIESAAFWPFTWEQTLYEG